MCFFKPYKNREMGCAFILGLTSGGTFKVCGLWSMHPVWKRDRAWPPKTFTNDKKSNKRLRKPLFLGELLPLHRFFSATSNWVCFLKYAGHTQPLPNPEKERNRCRQSGKVFVGWRGRGPHHVLGNSRITRGKVLALQNAAKQKKKKMHRFNMISFIAQIVTALHKAALRSGKGSCGDHSWNRARGNPRLSRKVCKSSQLVSGSPS